ncbi:glycosyltransferase [Tropicimonas sp. IMCC6043]|uniref:glycosyltransferase n=1 Tax=Tropicimonas sp. IMCC6043 TaxID=2510645 RepID=UPI00101BEE78|nr:glycosyltransferase [Tropicimonas sp. IMCC6043]RYH11528.1 glycosyltransferase family 1 protein [Tropicimonas sp. IMCC6043]
MTFGGRAPARPFLLLFQSISAVSARTYFFVIPEATRPIGGVNVAIQMASYLRNAGYDCHMLHATAQFSYQYFRSNVPFSYLPELKQVLKPEALRKRLRSLLKNPSLLVRLPSHTGRANIRPQDVIIAPEYLCSEIVRAFPGNPVVILVQGMMPLAIANGREFRRGAETALKNVAAIVATSQATAEAAEMLTGRYCHRVTLCVGEHSQGFSRQKKLQIAYMPRKRPEQIRFVLDCLRSAPELTGVNFVPIDGVGPNRVDEILRESLIFLNFPDLEGFGLPGAEAMLAGCIVVGYHGVGGAEYFDSDSGIPVPESDMVAFVRQVRSLVLDYRTDPIPLDRLREAASRRIAESYSQTVFEKSLRSVWAEIDAGLQSAAPANK